MYPHLVDRYRIIQKLVRLARGTFYNNIQQNGLSHQAVARASGVSQATISNVENLERSVSNSKRRISREDFLKTWYQA
jgi:transcriptional regulator with XRE-family HTH domain